MPKPDLTAVPEWYHRYIERAGSDDLLTAIKDSTEAALGLFHTIDKSKWIYRYAADKWSIKEMVQHLIDADRIFAYRALCFARQESISLPGFDENSYAAVSNADVRTKASLVEEFETVRKSLEQLFGSFGQEQLAATGISNNNPISVNAIGYITAGHLQHHLDILKERYL